MANMNNVVIGDNRIRYYDEILRISNISRTWIFRFQNIEKKKFEEQMQAYQNAKMQYEANETQKKKESVRKNIIVDIIFLLVSIFSFSVDSSVLGILFLVLTGIWGYLAYKAYMREILYPYQPPRERSFPDKFGLSIEMNSGQHVTFTAIGDDGVRALRKLQNDIEEADTNKNVIYFNMGDNNITVENNDGGVISTGDFANNVYHKGGQGN